MTRPGPGAAAASPGISASPPATTISDLLESLTKLKTFKTKVLKLRNVKLLFEAEENPELQQVSKD